MAKSLVLVYIAVNLMNGKRYVGITRGSLEERRRRHFCDARRGINTKFARAVRKYGESAFVFSALEFCPSYESAQGKEIELIAVMKPEYNSTKGGGGAAGFKHSPETIEKMRQAKLGKPGPWRGKKRPDISSSNRKRLLANPLRYWLGKKRDPELIKKIVAASRALPMTERQLAARKENIKSAKLALQKSVRCIDDGRVFSSLTDAARVYDTTKHCIWQMLKGNVRQTGGRRFEYYGGGI